MARSSDGEPDGADKRPARRSPATPRRAPRSTATPGSGAGTPRRRTGTRPADPAESDLDGPPTRAWAAATGEADAWHEADEGKQGRTPRSRAAGGPGAWGAAAPAEAPTTGREATGKAAGAAAIGKTAVGAAGAAAAAAATAAATAANRAGRLRTRVMPRSVLGIAALVLAFAIGAGFSGVVLFSYYQYKLNQTNDKVNTLVNGYKKQFQNSEGDLKADVAAAKASIQSDLNSAQQQLASPATLAALVKSIGPSVFFVHTLDANGQPSVGTAFVVASTANQSLLLTSYTTVEAATKAPGPPVYVRQGNTDTQVSVHTWDPQFDMALVVLPIGNLKPIPAAPSSPAPKPGDHLFAVSGLGSAGASISQGTVIDVASSGLAEDAAIGQAFQGGPIINQSGQVIAVGSRVYAPLGFSSQGVWYAPYVEAACNKVLSCPGGSLVGSH